MKPIVDDAELRRLHAAGHGLILNDFSGRGTGGAAYNVLHRAHCGCVARSNTAVRKYFFDDLHEAEAWLNANRSGERVGWKRCGSCAPGGHSSRPAVRVPIAASAEPPRPIT